VSSNHGTNARYNHGCKCARCKDAHAAHKRKYRRAAIPRRRRKGPVPIRHTKAKEPLFIADRDERLRNAAAQAT